MSFVVAEYGLRHLLRCAQLPCYIRPQIAMSMHITLGELYIDVMEQSGKPPHPLILAKFSGHRPHDRLGGQHVVDEVPIFHIGLNGVQGIVSGESLFLHLSPYAFPSVNTQ